MKLQDFSVHSTSCDRSCLCQCQKIESVESIKYLGLYIDKSLSWKEHVNKLIKKIRFGNCVLYKLASIASLKFLKSVYFAFVQSHLQYCLTLYGGTTATIIKPLEVLQKQAIRIINRAATRAHTASLFKNLKIL